MEPDRRTSDPGAEPDATATTTAGATDPAAEILRDSEERVAEASGAAVPSDAAVEHRRSEDTVGP